MRLAKRIERGDAGARDEMIESNLRLVIALARPFRGRGVPYADLIQEGTVGLVHAVEGFDHRRGHKFSTYAVWWIRRALQDALTDAQVIRVPQKAGRQLAAINRASAELERTGSATDGGSPRAPNWLSRRSGRCARPVALRPRSSSLSALRP